MAELHSTMHSKGDDCGIGNALAHHAGKLYAETCDLPKTNRFITTHDKTGKAVFSSSLKELMDFTDMRFALSGTPVGFFVGYQTDTFPSPLTNDEDLKTYVDGFKESGKGGLVRHGGTTLRYCDYPPGWASPMHRTESLDYGVVLEGEVECLLDSGEKRFMRRGDVTVQRGTAHSWVNRSKTEWARMMYVLVHATPVVIDGKALTEELGAADLPASH